MQATVTPSSYKGTCKYHKKLLLCIAFSFFVGINSHAQISKSYSSKVRGLYTTGRIGEHSENITHATRGFTHGFELIGTHLIPAKTRLNDRPQTVFLDLGFHYNAYSKDYMGESFAFSFGRSETFFERRNFELSAQFLHGIGYATKPYSQINNKNNAISTHLGFQIHANLTASYKLYRNWYALLGIGFNHLSNGAIKKPNLGYNVISGNFGLAYLVKQKQIDDDYSYYANSRNYYFHIIGSYFTNGSESFSSDKYPSYTFHAQVERNLSVHHSVLLGIDYNYNDKKIYADEPLKVEEGANNAHALGISASGSWKYSFVDFNLGAGVYLLKPWDYEKKTYFLVQFKFYTIQNLYLTAGLRAHGFKAIAFETGLGIKI